MENVNFYQETLSIVPDNVWVALGGLTHTPTPNLSLIYRTPGRENNSKKFLCVFSDVAYLLLEITLSASAKEDDGS